MKKKYNVHVCHDIHLFVIRTLFKRNQQWQLQLKEKNERPNKTTTTEVRKKKETNYTTNISYKYHNSITNTQLLRAFFCLLSLLTDILFEHSLHRVVTFLRIHAFRRLVRSLIEFALSCVAFQFIWFASTTTMTTMMNNDQNRILTWNMNAYFGQPTTVNHLSEFRLILPPITLCTASNFYFFFFCFLRSNIRFDEQITIVQYHSFNYFISIAWFYWQ